MKTIKSRSRLLSIIIVVVSLFFSLNFNTLKVLAVSPDNQTVEGEATHFVTGESYPQNIHMTGYDVTNSKIYYNFDLTTKTAVTPGQTASFDYFIEVFDNSSNKIGSEGSYASPTNEAAPIGSATLQLKNKEIDLTGALTTGYRYIVSIESVTVTGP